MEFISNIVQKQCQLCKSNANWALAGVSDALVLAIRCCHKLIMLQNEGWQVSKDAIEELGEKLNAEAFHG